MYVLEYTLYIFTRYLPIMFTRAHAPPPTHTYTHTHTHTF